MVPLGTSSIRHFTARRQATDTPLSLRSCLQAFRFCCLRAGGSYRSARPCFQLLGEGSTQDGRPAGMCVSLLMLLELVDIYLEN